MLAYLDGIGSCGTTSATGNAIPTVDAGTTKIIPKLTPFTLTATGSDADAGDIPNLRFVWEQLDAGGNYPNPPYGDQAGDPPTTTRPLFRPFDPVVEKSRTFPSLTYILNNANIPPPLVNDLRTAEDLPSVGRHINFRCTVRDQRGGVNDSAVAIIVYGFAGPFAVTFPNGGQTIGGAQNVTWDVSGTNAEPVSVASVNISLSTDGGNTFPIVLAANVPNLGTAGVTLPNGIITSTARIKVGLSVISSLISPMLPSSYHGGNCPAVSGITPQAGNAGTVVTITGVDFTGVNAVTFSGNIPAASFMVNNAMQISATVPVGAAGGPITLSKPSCPNVQTPGFSVCSNPPVAISVDDGSVESVTGFATYYVDRLTPASYPATLNQFSIFWGDFPEPPGSAIRPLSLEHICLARRILTARVS